MTEFLTAEEVLKDAKRLPDGSVSVACVKAGLGETISENVVISSRYAAILKKREQEENNAKRNAQNTTITNTTRTSPPSSAQKETSSNDSSAASNVRQQILENSVQFESHQTPLYDVFITTASSNGDAVGDTHPMLKDLMNK